MKNADTVSEDALALVRSSGDSRTSALLDRARPGPTQAGALRSVSSVFAWQLNSLIASCVLPAAHAPPQPCPCHSPAIVIAPAMALACCSLGIAHACCLHACLLVRCRLQETQPFFVRCVNPNDRKLASVFIESTVLRQLR